MLTLTFLGVGNAFAKRNLQSNALLEAWSASPNERSEPDDTVLIDCGTTAPLALHQLKDRPGFGYLDRAGIVNYPKIRRIFITHLHADHIGGLEELALMNVFTYARAGFRPQLISTSEVLKDLWEHSLKGSLRVLPGRQAGIEDYFVVRALNAGPADAECFRWFERYELQPFRTDHVRIDAKYDWPSLGVLIRDAASGDSAFFSGDTVFDFDAYAEMMRPARLCFHDVHLADDEPVVHASLKQLRTLPSAVKQKTFLYHYGDDWDSGAYAAVDREFAGFARPFHRYVLFD